MKPCSRSWPRGVVCPASSAPTPKQPLSICLLPAIQPASPARPRRLQMGEEAEEVQEAEEAGGARKRKRGEEVGDAEGDEAGVYEKDLLGDDGAAYEGIAEEAVAEVMRWLEAEIIADAPPAAADDSEAGGLVTINGNEESCGPSFSAASSTVMASVDTRAGAPPPPPVPWPWPVVVPSPGADMDVDAAGKQQTDVEMGMGLGGGGEAADEEWLARLLTCGGPLLEGVL